MDQERGQVNSRRRVAAVEEQHLLMTEDPSPEDMASVQMEWR